MRRLAFLAVLIGAAISALSASSAYGIVGGTDQLSDSFAAPIAYIELDGRDATFSCTGTLISPTVVMTAGHCVYDTTDSGNLIGIIAPDKIRVRVGARLLADPTQGTPAGVIAVLPQGAYRWDGRHRFHDIALLALDRAMTQTPARLPEQTPDPTKPLLIAGYGQTSTGDTTRNRPLRAGIITASDPTSCKLSDEKFDIKWLFCGASSTDPTLAVPGATACHGDSGGPAFGFENTLENLTVEGIISYGTNSSCEFSRTYAVLVSSERGFIDRALATPPALWRELRDDPPHASIKPLRRRVGVVGTLSVRIDDDKSTRSRIEVSFYTKKFKRVNGAFRSVKTNRWVTFTIDATPAPFNGFVCVEGYDKKAKLSNLACAPDVVRP